MAAIAQEELTPIIDRITGADYIFEGQVIASQPYFNHDQNSIYTSNIIVISKIFKGNLQCGTVEIITSGGQVGDVIETNSHLATLTTGTTGIFLCGDNINELPANPPLSPSNSNVLNLLYENQSYIQYTYVGQDIQISDMTQQFASLIDLYNLTEAVTQISYTDCGNATAVLPVPPSASVSPYRPDPVPDYTLPEYGREKVSRDYARVHLVRPKTSRANETLNYTISNQRVSGTNPKYFEYDIDLSDANAGASRYLAWAYARVEYDPAVFGDSVAIRGKITVTNGVMADTNCYFKIRITDESNFTVDLSLGRHDYNYCQSRVTGIPQHMAHVKMEMLGCGAGSQVTIKDTVDFFGSAVMPIESAYSRASNDSTLTLYNAVSTSGTTIPGCKAHITSFDPQTIAGGTYQHFHIHGYGFGDSIGRGNVYFHNASNGGASLVGLNKSDFASWQDTLIDIYVPNFCDTNLTGAGSSFSHFAVPGTGKFIIATNSMERDTSASPLTVLFSGESNFTIHDQKTANNLISKDTNGGYIFYVDTALWSHPDRKACVLKAVNDWKCLTGVKWSVAGAIVPRSDSVRMDSINIIQLGYTGNNSVGHILANTQQWAHACVNNIYVGELDLVFGKNVTWWYDTTLTNSVPALEYDFYATILHELGHAHSLDHVIDASAVMDYQETPGPRAAAQRKIRLSTDFSCDTGGNWVIDRSKVASYLSCTNTALPMQPHFICNPFTFGLDDQGQMLYSISASPVPFDRSLTLTCTFASEADMDIQLIDIQGRFVLSKQYPRLAVGRFESEIALSDIQQGLYYLVGHVNGRPFHLNLLCTH
jgi:hypothetical protein